jgi:hypothetical protein
VSVELAETKLAIIDPFTESSAETASQNTAELILIMSHILGYQPERHSLARTNPLVLSKVSMVA